LTHSQNVTKQGLLIDQGQKQPFKWPPTAFQMAANGQGIFSLFFKKMSIFPQNIKSGLSKWPPRAGHIFMIFQQNVNFPSKC
jgi:hypothetical protein